MLKNTIDFAADDHNIAYTTLVEWSKIARAIIYMYDCIPSDVHTSFGADFNALNIYNNIV